MVCTSSHQNKDCFPVSFFEFLCFYLLHCTRLYLVLPNTVIPVTWGPPSLGTYVFQSGLGSFLLKAVWHFHRPGGGSRVQDFLCVLNCWLTMEAIRRPSPGFWLWSWMKLACGKAKHCRLRCVFLTWNQLALHKYRGFLSQQRSEAGRAVRRVRRGRGLSVTSAPATVHLQAGSWKGRRVFLSKSFLPVFFSLLLLYVFLSLAWFKALCSDVDVTLLPNAVATEHPPRRHSLCWQELFGWWDLMLFGQANHNYRQKNAFFWGGCSGTVKIRFFFYLTRWQLVLLLMMVGKDVGCYN